MKLRANLHNAATKQVKRYCIIDTAQKRMRLPQAGNTITALQNCRYRVAETEVPRCGNRLCL